MIETVDINRVFFELDRVMLGHGVTKVVIKGNFRKYVFGYDGTWVDVFVSEDQYAVVGNGCHKFGAIDSRMIMRVVAEMVATITQVIVEGADA